MKVEADWFSSDWVNKIDKQFCVCKDIIYSSVRASVALAKCISALY